MTDGDAPRGASAAASGESSPTAAARAAALRAFKQLYGIPGTAVLQKFGEHGVYLMRADEAIAGLVEADGRWSWHGGVRCQLAASLTLGDATLAGLAYHSGLPQFVDDAHPADVSAADVEALGWRSASAMPLVALGMVVGALLVGRTTGVPWGRREVAAMTQWMTLQAVLAERRGTPLEPAEVPSNEDERLAARLFLLSPVPMCIVDASGAFRLVNDAFAEMAGRAIPQLLGTAVRAIVWPEPDDPTAGYFDELLAGRRRGYTALRKLALPDGTTRSIRAIAAQLRYVSEGRHLSFFIAEDVSASALQEHSIRVREERLRAGQRREALSQLAAGLAHEFNNALAAITGLASLLEEDLPEGDQRRGDASAILGVTRDASDLTRRLLDLSAERLTERARFDLRDVLRSFGAVARRVLPSTIEWHPSYPTEPVWADIDRAQVEQAVLGLVLNARDAMPEGGRLYVALERVEGGTEGAQVRLAVRDTGPGVAPELRERLFTPFFSTKPSGAGLGLPLALAVMQEHGGDLRLEDTDASGATFAAYLPLSEARAERRTPEAGVPVQTAEHRAASILLVEDDPLVQATTARILQRAGYAVRTCGDGQAALEAFEERPDAVDVVITDLQMPRLSGTELIRAIRRRRPDLRVVVTSAHPAESTDDRELRAASTSRLRKPFPVQALLQTIDALLEADA